MSGDGTQAAEAGVNGVTPDPVALQSMSGGGGFQTSFGASAGSNGLGALTIGDDWGPIQHQCAFDWWERGGGNVLYGEVALPLRAEGAVDPGGEPPPPC